MPTLGTLVYIHFLRETLADKIFWLLRGRFWIEGGASCGLEQYSLCFCLSEVAKLSSCS